MKVNISSRKGVSIVEVVVALVVISLISAATTSVIMKSLDVETKSVAVYAVRNSAENAMDCFRFADGDEGVFIDCLNDTISGNGFVAQSGSYVYDTESYRITITLLNEQKGFVYQAVRSDGKEIYSFTFQNGGVQE